MRGSAAAEPILVEAAVDTFSRALLAEADGVQRIELCGPLHDGGTTPSAGLIARCAERLLVSVFVLVRPRHGDFVYSTDEVEIMKRDIALARELGADGVVVGALNAAGEIDAVNLAELIAVAHPMRIGFHRAFDRVLDADESLELLVSMQVDHILTSGGAPTALEGVHSLRRLVERANGRIGITAGGAVSVRNVREIVERSGVRTVHGRAFEGMAKLLVDSPRE